jgi:hypothetical protein
MHHAKLPTPTMSRTVSKGDVRGLLQSILEAVQSLANSKLAKWAAIATIVSLPIAVVILIEGLPLSTFPVSKLPIGHSLEITQPSDAAGVGAVVDVRGTMSVDSKRRHYYLIVTPPQGSAQIQADPMSHSPGQLYGRAVLGNRSVGVAETFSIQILACNSVPISLLETPPDCESSKAVSVVRRY